MVKQESECRTLVCGQRSFGLPSKEDQGREEPEGHQPEFLELACAAQGCHCCKAAFEDVIQHFPLCPLSETHGRH